MKSNILDLHKKLVDKSITAKDLLIESRAKNKEMYDTNSVVNAIYDYAIEKADSIVVNENDLLAGIPYVLKDNIVTKGLITTAGSKFLLSFIPPYDSTIHTILSNQNALLVSKANMDEFGMGGTGTYSGVRDGIVKNGFNPEYTTGGSSSGSANLVAKGIVPFSLGTDTGDSIRRPASLMGVVGYKPTYGLISRYGVIPYAPSFDTVGFFTQYVADCAILGSKLFALDNKDYTCQELDHSDALFTNLAVKEQISFGVIKGLEEKLNGEIKDLYLACLEKVKSKYQIVEIDID